MKALARSPAAPSGVLCPVGKPSGATFIFGFATALESREINNGYAIVVAIGLLEMNLNVHAPTVLLYMAPLLILIFMEDPNWLGVLVFLAPLNAALYGGVAVAVTSVVQYLLQSE